MINRDIPLCNPLKMSKFAYNNKIHHNMEILLVIALFWFIRCALKQNNESKYKAWDDPKNW